MRHLQTIASRFAVGLALQWVTGSRPNISHQRLHRPRPSDGPSGTISYRIAAAYRLIGDIEARFGDDAAAGAAWSAGLTQLPRSGSERPGEMNERAELLRRLGRGNEAQQLAARLSATGFRTLT